MPSSCAKSGDTQEKHFMTLRTLFPEDARSMDKSPEETRTMKDIKQEKSCKCINKVLKNKIPNLDSRAIFKEWAHLMRYEDTWDTLAALAE